MNVKAALVAKTVARCRKKIIFVHYNVLMYT